MYLQAVVEQVSLSVTPSIAFTRLAEHLNQSEVPVNVAYGS